MDITCELFVDGVRFADAAPVGLAPVALDGLSVTWGRESVAEQPDASTCDFTIRDTGGGTHFRDLLTVGGIVEVFATGRVPQAGGGFGTDYVVQGSFENLAAGTAPANRVALGYSAAVTVRTDGGSDGTKYLRMTNKRKQVGPTVIDVPPDEFSSVVGAWDRLPQAEPGTTQRWSVDIRTPLMPGVVWIEPQLLQPTGASGGDVAGAGNVQVITSGTGWQTITRDLVIPENVHPGYWLALQFTASALTWAHAPGTWGSPPPVVDATNRATYPIGPTSAAVTGFLGTRCTVANPGGSIVGTVTDITAATMAQRFQRASNTRIAVPAGQPVTVSVDVRTTSGLQMGMSIYGYDAANVVIGGAVANSAWVSPASWTRVTVTLAAGPTTTAIDIQVGLVGTVPRVLGQTFEMRNVQVQSGTTDLPFFDGSTPTDASFNYRWTGAAQSSTSERVTKDAGPPPPGTWNDYAVTVDVDNMRLYPPAVTTRQVLVWSGRVSDMNASPLPDMTGNQVRVLAVDSFADLANRYVGDEPWPIETMTQRFTRILTLAAPASISAVVDAKPGAMQIIGRDVDNQSAGGLLTELATSTDGVLWFACHTGRGGYLWVEDTALRTNLEHLESVDGIWVILPGGSVNAPDAISLSACDVLADPVEWSQSAEEIATRVDVTWQEPTLPDPTERTFSLVDPTLEASYGVHRYGLSTQLTQLADATTVADRVMERARNIDWRMSGLVWDTYLPISTDTAIVNAAMDLLDGTHRLGIPIAVSELPEWSPAGTDVGVYCEGGTWEFRGGRWVFSMNVTPADAQGAEIVWGDAPPLMTWGTTDPLMIWSDLETVGA